MTFEYRTASRFEVQVWIFEGNILVKLYTEKIK